MKGSCPYSLPKQNQCVSDGLVAATLDHVRDDQLIELTVLAGTITMLNRYCTAFEIPPPGGDQ